MPCNGIAVVSGVIDRALIDLFFQLDEKTRNEAIAQTIKNQYPELGLMDEKVKPVPYQYQPVYTGFVLGNKLIDISKYGDVIVSNMYDGNGFRDRSTLENEKICEIVKNLIAGMAGYILQQQTVAQVQKSVKKVTKKQTAANGAIILNVEI